jgi:hypothetical protein
MSCFERLYLKVSTLKNYKLDTYEGVLLCLFGTSLVAQQFQILGKLSPDCLTR